MSYDDISFFYEVENLTFLPMEVLLLLLAWVMFSIIIIGIELFYEEREDEKPQNVIYKTAWYIASPSYKIMLFIVNFLFPRK